MIFDFGGTLLDLRPLVVYLAEELSSKWPALRPRSKDLALRWLRATAESLSRHSERKFLREEQIATASIRAVLHEAGISIDSSAAADLRRRAWGRFLENPRLHDDVSGEWLAGFRGLAAGLGIVSDGDEDSVFPLLDRLGIRAVFDAIVTSESVRAYKPQPRLYEAALEKLHTDARHTLFVSDTPSDLRGADAFGMGLVLVRREPADLPSPPPGTVQIRSLRDLPRIVRRFRTASGIEGKSL